MFYNSHMAIIDRRFRFSAPQLTAIVAFSASNNLEKSFTFSSSKKFREKTVGFLKKVFAVFIFAIVFATFSCRNASDDGGDDGDSDSNLDLESYIFLRHRFAEENAEISSGASDADKLAWSKKHFADAKDYMVEKVADFKHKVRDLEPAGNFLQPICDEIWTGVHGNDVNGYENGGSGLDPIIGNNNYNYTKFLGATAAKLMIAGGMDYDSSEKFEAHYAALAVRAYNDSLGRLHDSDKLTFNQERESINTTLQSEPVNAPYTATDYTLVEQNLRSMLESVSAKTSVSVETLIDAVNLNLLNVGMWGAGDLAALAGFQLSSSDKLLYPSSQIHYLNRRELLHNMGTWSYLRQYEKEQQNNQEQGRGL